ncbi:MAG TPA: hypothetical protein ENF87_00875, partial [Thermoproteales archaeon]|nr:hypothetical protein [Thermoproteales archaeon]
MKSMKHAVVALPLMLLMLTFLTTPSTPSPPHYLRQIIFKEGYIVVKDSISGINGRITILPPKPGTLLFVYANTSTGPVNYELSSKGVTLNLQGEYVTVFMIVYLTSFKVSYNT